MARFPQLSAAMERSDIWVYRTFGRNWMQRVGASLTAVATFVHFQFPPGTNTHRWAGVGIGLGAMLGQLGSIAPADVRPNVDKEGNSGTL